MIIESNDKDSSKSSSQAKDTTAVNNEDVNHKHEHEDKHEHYYHHVAEAAAGDKNDDVTRCRICDSNGWAHEHIKWSKIYGRVLSDVTMEILGYKPINYVTDT
jgi:hypothetical protein